MGDLSAVMVMKIHSTVLKSWTKARVTRNPIPNTHVSNGQSSVIRYPWSCCDSAYGEIERGKCILAIHKTQMNHQNSRHPKVKDPSMTLISIGKRLPDTVIMIPMRTNA